MSNCPPGNNSPGVTVTYNPTVTTGHCPCDCEGNNTNCPCGVVRWTWDGTTWNPDGGCVSPCLVLWPAAAGHRVGQTTTTCCVDLAACGSCGYVRWYWNGSAWSDDGAYACGGSCTGVMPTANGAYVGQKVYACCTGGGLTDCCLLDVSGATAWPDAITLTVAGSGVCAGEVTLNKMFAASYGYHFYGYRTLASACEGITVPPYFVDYLLRCIDGRLKLTVTVADTDAATACYMTSLPDGTCCPSLSLSGTLAADFGYPACTECCGEALTTYTITGNQNCCECFDIGTDITLAFSVPGGAAEGDCLDGYSYRWTAPTGRSQDGLCHEWRSSPHEFPGCGETNGEFDVYCMAGGWVVYYHCGGLGTSSTTYLTGQTTPTLYLTADVNAPSCTAGGYYLATVTGPGPGSMAMSEFTGKRTAAVRRVRARPKRRPVMGGRARVLPLY